MIEWLHELGAMNSLYCWRIGIMIALSFVTGCGFMAPVRQRPAEKDLFGYWKSNDGKSSIILEEDRFIAERLPSIIDEATQNSAADFSGEGKWRLRKQNQAWVVELEWEGFRAPNTITFFVAELWKESGKGNSDVFLAFWIGDPDDLNQFRLYKTVSKYGRKSD